MESDWWKRLIRDGSTVHATMNKSSRPEGSMVRRLAGKRNCITGLCWRTYLCEDMHRTC
jgi:hypothetical protein